MLSSKALLPNNWIVERPAALLKKGTNGFPDCQWGKLSHGQNFCRASTLRVIVIMPRTQCFTMLDLFGWFLASLQRVGSIVFLPKSMSVQDFWILDQQNMDLIIQKKISTRYCLGWTFSWSMSACQKSQRPGRTVPA